jgi:hypothetical protein
MMKMILVTLVLFQWVRFKTIEVFDTKMTSMRAKGLMVVRRPLKREAPSSRGYGLFYTCTPEQIRRSQLESNLGPKVRIG